jgi:hypothetical protein
MTGLRHTELGHQPRNVCRIMFYIIFFFGGNYEDSQIKFIGQKLFQHTKYENLLNFFRLSLSVYPVAVQQKKKKPLENAKLYEKLSSAG